MEKSLAKHNGSREAYRVVCNMVKKAINAFHAGGKSRIINCKNRRAFFKYINARLCHSKCIPTFCKTDSGQLLSTDDEIADAFNKEFSLNFGSVLATCCTPSDPEDLLLSCTLTDVQKYFSNVPNSATGFDGISGKVLKNIKTSVAYPLWIIFQQSLAQATFPALWKEAIIKPIYKNKGDKTSPSSYRPCQHV